MSEPDEGQRFKDLWAWADEDGDDTSTPPVSPSFVVGVLVVRDAAPWLPDQLAALEASTQRPGRLIAVDAGSTDESPAILEEAGALFDKVVTVERDAGFAATIAAAIEGETVPWLWILHDDALPEPDALAELLAAAPTADLLYPKLLAPRRRNYPDVIAECGQSITRGGQRVHADEVGDVDQMQLEPAAILGGSTAGMLVRGDLWRELDGLAPELDGHRDGVDLGWRANVAGWRVVTAPRAALVHLGAGSSGERPSDEHPHVGDRLAALRIVAARGTGGARLTAGSWARSLGFLLAKSPGHAGAELRALRRFRRTKDTTDALAARIPDGDPSAVEDLLAPRFWLARTALDRTGSAIADRYRDFTADTSLDELTSDEFGGHEAARKPLVAPGALLVLGFLLAGLGAGWRLWGSTDIAGGGLLPAPSSLIDAWATWLSNPQPALGVGAVVGTALLGQVWLANLLLVLLGPLVAALAARSLLRALGVRTGLAAVGAGLWGAGVLALGLPSSGDVSGLVAAIAGPLLAKAIHRLLTRPAAGAEGLRAPAVGALWLFLCTAFWPAALALVTLGAIALALARRGRPAQWAMLVVPVWLLVVPWTAELLTTPGRFLTGVDPLAWPDVPPSGYALLLGRLAPAGIPLWLSAVVVGGLALLAAWGLLRIPQAGRRWIVAAAIVVPLLAGAGLSRLAITVEGGQTRALLSPWALLVLAGMIAAVLLAERPRDTERRGGFGPIVAALLVAVAVVAWPFVGLRGPVAPSAEVLPSYVRDVVHSPRDSRALLIDRSGDRLAWNVVDARAPQWGSGETHPGGADSRDFEGLVQAFAGGNVPDDLATQLRDLAVSHVWVSGFGPDELLAIRNAAGLTDAPASDTATVFTVTGLVSRAAVVDGEERTPVVDGQVPAGGDGRVLTVVGPEDQRVAVGDVVLERTDDGAYALGSHAGELRVGEPADWFTFVWSLVLLAGIGLVALPTLAGATARRGGE